jgi:(R,R)-butanediol dehydrogenase/meso-butanediol dehydrogenase/diacetyl reductase
MTIGHEFLGVVEEIGPDVHDLSIGDRVVAGAGQWCGRCRYCLAGRTNLCEQYYSYGLNRDGGLAEAVTVPAQMLVVVPESVDDFDAVLAQPVAVAVHAVTRSGATSLDAVAVIGAGAIGALVIAALADIGVAPTVFDIDSGRLDTALALGAGSAVRLDPVAGPSDPGLGDRFGSFDISFDTSGIESSLGSAIGITVRGGRVVAVGLPGRPVPIDSHDAVVREIDIVTSSAHVCRTDLPAAVALLERTSIHAFIVGEVVSLADVPEAMQRLADRRAAGKTIVRIGAGSSPASQPGRKEHSHGG